MEQGGTRLPRILRMGLAGLLVQFSERLDDVANRHSGSGNGSSRIYHK